MDTTNHGISKTPAKSGARKTVSCGECQRRKQKCDRQWPCNQCTARRRVHLCRFETKKRKEIVRENSSILLAAASQSTKTSSDDEQSSPKSSDAVGDEIDKPFNIASMGFGVGASILADLKQLDIHDPPPNNNATSTALALLTAIPPRPYANLLVRFFLEDYNNNFFCIIHRETFMEAYANLWKERNREKWDLNFAALLLNMCAVAVQFLPDKDGATIEELNPSRKTLSGSYVDASEKLLDMGAPGTCIERVLAHCLMSFWLKNEGRASHGWHRLSRAIREAQELQMHIDPPEDKFSDFEAQLRRYVWMIIRTTDNHISRSMTRPRMITNSSCTVSLPLPSFEGADGSDPNGPSPSPTVQPWYEHQLSSLFTDEEYTMFGMGDDGGDVEIGEKFYNMSQRVLDWAEKLPGFLKCPSNPACDKHWDAQAPYLMIQRAHMHSQVHHVLSSIYRSYMRLSYPLNRERYRVNLATTYPRTRGELPGLRMRQAGVANALALLQANKEYFETIQPHHYCYAPLSMHPFEPSVQLCMFLLTETSLDPMLYDRVVEAVSAVLDRYAIIRNKLATACVIERNELGWFADNAHTVLKGVLRKVEQANLKGTSSTTSSSGPIKVAKAPKPAQNPQPTVASTEATLQHIGGATDISNADPSAYFRGSEYQGSNAFGRELGYIPAFDYTADITRTANQVAEDPQMEWNFELDPDMVRSMFTPSFKFDPSDYNIDLDGA